VVLAICVVAVSGAIIASQQQIAAQEEDSTAITLGRQLMEEITALPLTPTDATAGWPTVTDRTLYDSLIDFNGYTDKTTVALRRTNNTGSISFSTAVPSVTAITSGTPTLAAQDYLRTVSVTYPTSIFGTTVTSGEFAVITVTVTGGKGNKAKLSKLMAHNTITR
jgi:hypothetical protein